jgi:hypothetical protein
LWYSRSLKNGRAITRGYQVYRRLEQAAPMPM